MSALEESAEFPSLDELLATIRREHKLTLASWKEGLEHAILVGHAVIAAREIVEPGGWIAWCAENLPFSIDQARRYVRFATYEDQVRQSQSISDAIRTLRGLPPAAPRGVPRTWVDEAREMQEAGLSIKEISEELERSKASIYMGLSSEQQERREARVRELRRQRTDERKALLVIRRTAAAQGFGGGIAEAYSLCRRLSQTLDRVHRDEKMASEIKRLAGMAYTELLEIEGYIGRMVGAE